MEGVLHKRLVPMAVPSTPWQFLAAPHSHIEPVLLQTNTVLEALALDAEHALQTAYDMLALANDGGDPFEQGRAMVLVGLCAEALGRRDQAREWYREALTAMAERRGSPWYGLTYCFRGRVDADADDIPAAELFFSEAARLLGMLNDAGCVAVQRLCRGHLELARARRARYAGRVEDAELARDVASDVAATVAEPVLASALVRLAKQQLSRALLLSEEGDCPPPGSLVPSSLNGRRGARLSLVPSGGDTSTLPPPSARTQQLADDALVVSFSGRAARDTAGGYIDLSTRSAPRRILKALADQRERAPGLAVSCQQLLAAGWPGERMVAQAGSSRVYTAIATLRRMGLKHYLKRRDGGYLLDPATPLVRCPDTHVDFASRPGRPS